MYKYSVVITAIVFAVVSIISYILSLDHQYIASAVIDIMAIASAIYLAIYPLLQSSDELRKRLMAPDKILKRKSQMGVINTYLKVGLIMGIVSIGLGCTTLLIVGSYKESIKELPMWYRIYSSICIGQFAMNFPLLWYVGKFMVNRVAFNR